MYFRSYGCLALIVFCFFFSCKKQNNLTNDLEQWKLKGKVRFLSEINYSKSGKYLTNISFNKNGFVTEQSSFNPDGSLIRKWVYTYGEKNQKLTRKCYIIKDSLSYTMYYFYNESGKITSTKQYQSNGTLGLQVSMQYDKNMNMIKEITFDENTKIQNLVFHKYDDHNRLMEDNYIDSILHKNWKQRYKYNKENLTETISFFSKQDCLINSKTYSYLKNNKVEKQYLYDSKKQFNSVTTYKYDYHGNTIEIADSLANRKPKETQTFKYKYDKFGNWSFFVSYINDKVEVTITRELQYFE